MSIQFHALPGELASFVEQCMGEMRLNLIAVTFPPWTARVAALKEISEVLRSGGCIEMILCEEAPLLPIATQTELFKKHPRALTIVIGQQNAEGLRQSVLSCGTDGPPISAVWKRIANKLRAATKAGALAVNPDTGAVSRTRNFRFTPGAKALCDQGVPILPLAGGTFLKLGIPDSK